MAEISRITVKESERGKMLCIWMDNGDVTYTPMSIAIDEAVKSWANGALDDVEFLDAVTGVSDADIDHVAQVVNHKLERINRNLTTDGIHVYYDGDTFEKVKLDIELEKHLIKLLKERNTEEGNADFESWAAFASNLYGNVTPYIREQLVTWMKAQDWLSFTNDGCFIGYRGAQKNVDTGIAESIHSGPAIVDGEAVNGTVPNPDGAIVEMPRGDVVDNPSLGCEKGLHVGTFEYASNWAHDIVMRVKVDPRDVVSVPVDCSAQKIRCCRFEVLDHVDLSDPNAEETFKQWGVEWTYIPPVTYDFNDDEYGFSAYDYGKIESPYASAARHVFWDMHTAGVPSDKNSDWNYLFSNVNYINYCRDLIADGIDDLPEYSDWEADVFEDYLRAYSENEMPDYTRACWEKLFGVIPASNTMDFDDVSDYYDDLDDYYYDYEDDIEVDSDDVPSTVNAVSTGLFGNIRTPYSPRNKDVSPAHGRNTVDSLDGDNDKSRFSKINTPKINNENESDTYRFL